MSQIVDDDPTVRIAARIRAEREARGWSLTELAERSGVSRAMINKVERGESSPTATLLGRLSGALELTVSALFAEPQPGRLRRAADRPRWIDPETGYVRRQISPDSYWPKLDIVEIELPPGESVGYPAAAYGVGTRAVWVLAGVLTFVEGAATHVLGAGDCLRLGQPADCEYRNETVSPVRYAVVVA